MANTWTEGTEHVAPRAALGLRAGREATRQVGKLAMPVAIVACELGVCSWTVMDTVVLHGTPLVEKPARVGKSYRAGVSPHLDHALRAADPFHVVRTANRSVDKVRRQVQNERLDIGAKDNPLYRIRRLLLSGSERLTEGDGHRLLARAPSSLSP